MKKNNNNNKRIYPMDNNNHDNGNDKTMIGRDVEETNNESTKKILTENGNEHFSVWKMVMNIFCFGKWQ